MRCFRIIAKSVLLGACAALLVPTPTHAQNEWSDRAFLNVNLGMQLTSWPFEESLTPIIYSEKASIQAPHQVEGGWLTLDIAGGVRVWRSLGVGVAYTRFPGTEDVNVVAQVPNPIFFNEPRIANKVQTLERTVTVIDLQVVYGVPLSPRMDVLFSAGPSLIGLKQDLVARIDLMEEEPPHSSVSIASVATVTRDENTVGLNVGADLTYFLTRLVGVGGTVRYTFGSATTEQGDGNPIDLGIGGFQFAVGVRVRFR